MSSRFLHKEIVLKVINFVRQNPILVELGNRGKLVSAKETDLPCDYTCKEVPKYTQARAGEVIEEQDGKFYSVRPRSQ